MLRTTNLNNRLLLYFIIISGFVHISFQSRIPKEKKSFQDQIFLAQRAQFNDPDSGYISPYLNIFKLLNDEVLRNKDSDTFWIAFTFRVSDQLFEVLYLSSNDTIIYSYKNDSIIRYIDHKEYLSNYDFLINKLVNDKEIPKIACSGPQVNRIVLEINLSKNKVVRKCHRIVGYTFVKRKL